MDTVREAINGSKSPTSLAGPLASPNSSLKRHRNDFPGFSVPGAFDDASSFASASSDATQDDSDNTTPVLSRQGSGLPPTPPTTTNSETTRIEPVPRLLSPAPIFADRVRNALETHKSSPTTPVMENSPPTPDPSPPSRRSRSADHDITADLRPPLPHYPSSYADSFKTATEGRSASGSTSNIHLYPADLNDTPKQSWLDANKAAGLSNARLASLQAKSVLEDADSEIGETRVKNYHIDSDSSDAERNGLNATGEDKSTTDSAPNSPLQQHKPTVRPLVIPRLRKPILPGDLLKGPEDSLLYGPSFKKWQKPAHVARTPPRREMDTEYLRNARPVLASASPVPASGKRDAPPSSRHNTDLVETAQLQSPAGELKSSTPDRSARALREFAPSQTPKEFPTPPSTAQNEKSLDQNNTVYRMLQEQNIKRHSAISEGGGLQARVISFTEHKRKLRHTPKRDSLRGDASLVESHLGSVDGAHRLRHKRALDSLGSIDPIRPPVSSPHHAVPNSSARVLPPTQSDKRFSYGSDLPRATYRVASAHTLDQPRKLRRSLRENTLDKTRSVSDYSRPFSMSLDMIPSQIPRDSSTSSPRLRRSSGVYRLEHDQSIRRTSRSHDALGLSLPEQMPSIVARLENGPQRLIEPSSENCPKDEHEVDRSPVLEKSFRRENRLSGDKGTLSGNSPRPKSLDYRSLHPSVTPISNSQFSGTLGSDGEVCEAQGVVFFPHNNESLVLVQSARPAESPESTPSFHFSNETLKPIIPGIDPPNFNAFVTSPDVVGMPLHSVDSPLTHPRIAPQPPIINCIPPTPNDELDRQLVLHDERQNAGRRPRIQRRVSMKERARHLTETLISPLPFSRSNFRSHRSSAPAIGMEPPASPSGRPTHLNPFWQPRGFWESYESSDDEYDEYEDDEDALPPGGDTSDLRTAGDRKRLSGLFGVPRSMSRRMPGFQGTGGFHLGNSLGIDRHGTNARRHHVNRTINRKTSEDVLRRISDRQKGKSFAVPFGGGRKVTYVGLTGLRTKMREARRMKREHTAEKRRDKLRKSIGTRVYHDGGRSGLRPSDS